MASPETILLVMAEPFNTTLPPLLYIATPVLLLLLPSNIVFDITASAELILMPAPEALFKTLLLNTLSFIIDFEVLPK